MSTDKEIEQEIKAVGADVAPRITPTDIEANIASEHYFTAEDGVGRASRGQTSNGGKNPESLALLTFCVLVLRNGFTVTGESACASPENFDAEVGRKIARANAVNKIWPLMGYELRSKLHVEAPAAVEGRKIVGLHYSSLNDTLTARLSDGTDETVPGYIARGEPHLKIGDIFPPTHHPV